jgi:hypothetical protein
MKEGRFMTAIPQPTAILREQNGPALKNAS